MLSISRSLYGKILAANSASIVFLALLSLLIITFNEMRDAQHVLSAKAHNFLD